MPRRASVRFAVVLSSILTLAAGCAAHPERPEAAPAHADASPTGKVVTQRISTAQLLNGCKRVPVKEEDGWAIDCGVAIAGVSVHPRRTPKEAVADVVDAFRSPKGTTMRTYAPWFVINGRRHGGTEFEIYKGPKATDVQQVGLLIGLVAKGGARVAFCDTGSNPGMKRCPSLLIYAAEHPRTPPKLAVASMPPAPWPARGKVTVPPGCTRVDSDAPDEVHLDCGDTLVSVSRFGDHPESPASCRKVAAEAAKGNRALVVHKGGHASAATPFPCTVSGKPGACTRLRVDGPKGSGELVLAVGEMFATTVVVDCYWPATSGDQLPPGCSAFVGMASGH